MSSNRSNLNLNLAVSRYHRLKFPRFQCTCNNSFILFILRVNITITYIILLQRELPINFFTTMGTIRIVCLHSYYSECHVFLYHRFIFFLLNEPVLSKPWSYYEDDYFLQLFQVNLMLLNCTILSKEYLWITIIF